MPITLTLSQCSGEWGWEEADLIKGLVVYAPLSSSSLPPRPFSPSSSSFRSIFFLGDACALPLLPCGGMMMG